MGSGNTITWLPRYVLKKGKISSNSSLRLWLIHREWHQITTEKTVIVGIKLIPVKTLTQFATIHPVTFLVRGFRKTTLEKSASSYRSFSFYVYYVSFMSMADRPGITHIRSHIGNLTSHNRTSAQPHPSPPLRRDLPRTETPRRIQSPRHIITDYKRHYHLIYKARPRW